MTITPKQTGEWKPIETAPRDGGAYSMLRL